MEEEEEDECDGGEDSVRGFDDVEVLTSTELVPEQSGRRW